MQIAERKQCTGNVNRQPQRAAFGDDFAVHVAAVGIWCTAGDRLFGWGDANHADHRL
ncbi:hypothetical protein D3C75_1300430 [compost metagenome]